MAHAPGWTLATARLVFDSIQSNDLLEVVLHYDMGGVTASDANALTAATAMNAAIAGPVLSLISNDNRYLGCGMTLDDGTNQGDAFNAAIGTGTGGANALPQVVCAIIRKRCANKGRKRFGHMCWPGIAGPMLVDENNLSVTAAAALTAFAINLQSGINFFGAGVRKMIIYHRADDTRNDVDYIEAQLSLRTQRHRTPGRGV